MKDDEQQENLTREDYQRQKQAEEEKFSQRDRKRVQVEKEYAWTHDENIDEETVVEPNVRNTAERKSRNLGRKLNWVIFALVVAIVIVYLILFFVK
ncbi:hypothetical protein SIN07_03915 [Pediococcus inopinatus]|uniref:Uncharacterized protein n=1 Tax=Pediococcus inopinatus TaxID=114090 RepID=A0ABZ0Q3B4_9LACO|nr:hypothetical protein [Pediococcus inopinatus]WPC19221.1 hypothetical protein N6G95_08250 [Pediococcus inopinatus]WPC21012.1 hypothetical protein N6G96_06840 [Pediococcus inopinatus]WPP09994.1 hypothetical protein SIN07_03915 [Pediococcus inopinatus]